MTPSERSFSARAWPVSRRGLLLGAGLLAAGPRWFGGRAAAKTDPLSLEEVAPGGYVQRGVHALVAPSNLGHIANVGCVIGDRAVAVIDSGGSAIHGRRLRAAIRALTDKPIRYVIATHMHPDHLFGHAAFLLDQPTFVGHARLPAALAARGAYYLDNLRAVLGDLAEGTEVVMPDLLVEDETTLDLGNRRLTLKAHHTAHTDNDLTVFDRQSRLLWTGDLVFVGRCPVVDGSLLGWIEVLDGLRRHEAAAIVPGHGPARAIWPDAMAAERRYLTRLRDALREFLAAGGLLDDAVSTVRLDDERPNWALFDRYHGRNVSAAYAELEWE